MISKTNLLSLLAVLSIILVAGFASAAASAAFVPASVSLNASHNSDVTVSFALNNTGDVNFTELNWTASGATWKTLPSSTTLNAGESKSFSSVLSVPKHASGAINAHIDVFAIGSTNTSASLPVTVNIANSPSLSIADIQSLTKTQNATINITNTGNTNLNSINLSFTGDFNVSFSDSSIFALTPGNSKIVNVNSLSNLNSLDIGTYTVTITSQDTSTNASATQQYSVTKDFCSNGNANVSAIEITDLEDTSSENDWQWKPLDDVIVKVKVENSKGSEDDFVVRLAIYDTEKKEFIDIDDESYLEESFTLDDDDSETITFEFKVPAELQDSDGRYVVYVKAYVDGSESTYCNSYAGKNVPGKSVDNLEIDRKSRDVILDEITFPELVSAGESVRIHANVYNIGVEDESKVKVVLKNAKLGLNLEQTLSSIDSDDSDDVEFSFVIPATAENGLYTFSLYTMYNYKTSSDTYSKESSKIWSANINVAGGVTINATAQLAGITASLDSEAKAGSTMDVTVTVKNLGTSATTFVIGAKNYESWATLKSISERIITLNAGASKDIKISFDINKTASGEKSFTIETTAGSKVETKEIAVTIAKAESALASLFGGNALIWVIGIINVVLIVLIIIIGIRILKR